MTLVFERVKPASAYRRVKDEAYPTPWWVARAVVPFLPLTGGKVWEVAAGHGRLVRALRYYGCEVVGTTSNFLDQNILPDYVRIIVTNPPYGKGGRLAVAFIEHALDLMMHTRLRAVAMLLRIDFDSAGGRTDLFRDCPQWARKVVLLDRVKWFDGNGKIQPSTNHAWFLWDKWHRGPAVISYAEKISGAAK